MSIGLYMDVHVPAAAAAALRLRGVDVLTAQEDGAGRMPDDELLGRATSLGRALVSQDEDLLAEAAKRQVDGEEFAGVVYAHQMRVTVGQLVRDLEMIGLAGEPKDLENRVVYLPL